MSTKFRYALCFKAVAVLLGCWLLTCAAAQERDRFGIGFSTGIPRPLAAVSLSADLTDARRECRARVRLPTLFGGAPARVPPLWTNLDIGLINRSLLGEGLSIYFGSGFSFRF